MSELIFLVPLLPLVGAIINGFFGTFIKNEKIIGWIGSLTVGIAFLLVCLIFFDQLSLPPESRSATVTLFPWIVAGKFDISIAYLVDPLSLTFALFVTGVGFLIHVYSIGYMHGDRGFFRFFAYLNLFIFMMLNLVLADNLLLTFLGWEGVGLCSYLLIGFWYDQKFSGTRIEWTVDAAQKAFIVNRIGDFGMILAMFILFALFGTLRYLDVNAAAVTQFPDGSLALTIAALLIFLGCTGKSAQIPLYVWLPDAMAGPTPVSALIHAATMVTSGIFLVARLSPLFALSPAAMGVVAVIGIATAFIAATIGLVQNDIKKVLAYSTVSQLGYMFAALGVGAVTAAVFHVVTHAFFKALLFLGAGSVIHAMHEEQDIQKMGGLKKYMPTTYWTFVVAALAISGIPPLSGFFSKDEILWNLFINGSTLLWLVGAITALLTAFYMFRLVHLTFHGTPRFDPDKVHPHESPPTMTVPLIVLAILSIVGGFLGIPHAFGHALHIPHFLEQWLHPVLVETHKILGIEPATEIHPIEFVLMGISVVLALIGIAVATWFYITNQQIPQRLAERFRGLYQLLWNKYYVDELYYTLIVDPLWYGSTTLLWKITDVGIIDGTVNGIARLIGHFGNLFRKIQTGIAQSYAVMMVAGIVLILIWMLFL